MCHCAYYPTNLTTTHYVKVNNVSNPYQMNLHMSLLWLSGYMSVYSERAYIQPYFHFLEQNIALVLQCVTCPTFHLAG